MNKMTILVGPGAREEGGGLTNFMSWTRFEQTLRASGEVRPVEHIDKIVVDQNGMQIYYKSFNVKLREPVFGAQAHK